MKRTLSAEVHWYFCRGAVNNSLTTHFTTQSGPVFNLSVRLLASIALYRHISVHLYACRRHECWNMLASLSLHLRKKINTKQNLEIYKDVAVKHLLHAYETCSDMKSSLHIYFLLPAGFLSSFCVSCFTHSCLRHFSGGNECVCVCFSRYMCVGSYIQYFVLGLNQASTPEDCRLMWPISSDYSCMVTASLT